MLLCGSVSHCQSGGRRLSPGSILVDVGEHAEIVTTSGDEWRKSRVTASRGNEDAPGGGVVGSSTLLSFPFEFAFTFSFN